jgi:hypothetical protein
MQDSTKVAKHTRRPSARRHLMVRFWPPTVAGRCQVVDGHRVPATCQRLLQITSGGSV